MTQPDRTVRPFAAWLNDQRSGLTHSELSDALNELIEAVGETGKAGKLTFTVSIKPEGGMVVVRDEIEVKLPKPDRDPSLFFVDEDNNLTRDNPFQGTLALRGVSEPPAEREVDPETGEIREVAAR
jgi:hypothetical protein